MRASTEDNKFLNLLAGPYPGRLSCKRVEKKITVSLSRCHLWIMIIRRQIAPIQGGRTHVKHVYWANPSQLVKACAHVDNSLRHPQTYLPENRISAFNLAVSGYGEP